MFSRGPESVILNVAGPIETGGRLRVTGNHVCCKSFNISETTDNY